MPRPDVSDERIAQILNAATHVFSQYGIDAASMTQIAKAADISKAMIYYYFDSKEALIEALVRDLFDTDQAALDTLLNADIPALERIQSYAMNLTDLLEERAELYAMFAEFRARAMRVSTIYDVIHAYFNHYIETFTQIIAQGIENGEIDATINPADTALTLTALVEGCIVLQHNLGQPLKHIMQTTVNLFLKEIAT